METLAELARQEEQPLSLASVWNASVASREDRPVEPRQRIWASELGKGIHDVILKLRGEVPSNPPNARSIRKFEAGNMFEWIVRLVLMRSGILQESQTRLTHQYDGLLEVSGKLDFLAGGVPKYDIALDGIKDLMMPEFLERSMVQVNEYLKEKCPGGFSSDILEVKSVSAYMFESLEKTRNATRNHRMQLFHYLKAMDKQSGKVIYICRDDLRMMEVEVFNSPENEEEYRSFIEEVTRIYNSGEMPMPEAKIVYDTDIEKFAKNWNVAYSDYLTKVYGYKDQKEFDDIHVPIVSRWNRVLMRARKANARKNWLESNGVSESDIILEKVEGKRVKQQYIITPGTGLDRVYVPAELQSGHEMTTKNLEVVKEIEDEGFDFAALAARMKQAAEDEELDESWTAEAL